jgi:hypothetical protein
VNPYIIAAIASVCAFLGGLVWHEFDQVRYDKLDKDFTAYKTESQANAKQAQATAAADTARLKDQADNAHNAFLQEQSDNAAYRASHPDQSVRLCLSAPDSAGVRQASNAKPGAPAASPGASGVQSVHDGDTGVRTGAGPDISLLLRAIAARADDLSGQLRECQSRLPTATFEFLRVMNHGSLMSYPGNACLAIIKLYPASSQSRWKPTLLLRTL